MNIWVSSFSVLLGLVVYVTILWYSGYFSMNPFAKVVLPDALSPINTIILFVFLGLFYKIIFTQKEDKWFI